MILEVRFFDFINWGKIEELGRPKISRNIEKLERQKSFENWKNLNVLAGNIVLEIETLKGPFVGYHLR